MQHRFQLLTPCTDWYVVCEWGSCPSRSPAKKPSPQTVRATNPRLEHKFLRSELLPTPNSRITLNPRLQPYMSLNPKLLNKKPPQHTKSQIPDWIIQFFAKPHNPYPTITSRSLRFRLRFCLALGCGLQRGFDVFGV